jgi:hypothetical protein
LPADDKAGKETPMKARRIPYTVSDQGDALGYEAATPHLTRAVAASAGWRTRAPAAARSHGLVSPAILLGTVFGLGATSVVSIALLAWLA